MAVTFLTVEAQNLTDEQKASARKNIGITGTSADGDSGMLLVTLDLNTSSHSASEIRAAMDKGKVVIATLYGTVLDLEGFQDDGAYFALYVHEEYGTNIVNITVREDKTCTVKQDHAPNVVNVSVEENRASHTPGQIKTYSDNGALVVLRYDGRCYTLQQVREDGALFSCARGPAGPGDASHIYTVGVLSDGTISAGHSEGSLVPEPGREDWNKVLGATEYGCEWVDPPEGGSVDLVGYATEQWVQEGYQPKGEYLTAVPDGYAKITDIPTKPEDIGAQPADNYLTEVPSGYATEEFVRNRIAEAELGGEEVDLSGYAQKSEIPTKVSQLQNDSGYLTKHQDISGKLDASALPTAINTALAQAKASGEFDGESGKDGKTPVKGTDYFTASDKTEMVNAVLAALPIYAGEVEAV